MNSTTPSSRPNSISQSSQPVNGPSKLVNGVSSQNAAKPAKPAPPTSPAVERPRVDMQVFHDALKTSLPKPQWAIYTEALNKFFSGTLNHEELRETLSPFLKGVRIRYHNALLLGMISNLGRDNPSTDVGPWVSASDKPSSSTKLPAGDINERRLKKEVMAISARERRRIKEVPDLKNVDVEDVLGSMLQEYHIAKQIRTPEAQPPKSATLNKTNWESEIKQRYQLPLACETGEFPDVESIRLRILPICYEEGVPGGCTHEVAQFMNVAAETFVKEVLTTIISRVRSNGSNYVKTDKYKKLRRKGKYHPPERPLLGMHDVRLSLTLGDNMLTQLPLSMKKIMAGAWYERDYEVDTDVQFLDDDLPVDGWEGGGAEDRKQLRSVLDDCLTMVG